jgi:hypothetical protein
MAAWLGRTNGTREGACAVSADGQGHDDGEYRAAEMAQAVMDARKTSWIGAIYIYSWQDLGTNRHANAD